jgi:DNA repair protein RecN (Recombination protein N)
LGLPDDGPELCIRRVVGRQGRGRVHVNGTPVTVGVLQRLMRGQVDIAGQHEHMALFDTAAHLALVDRFGGVGEGSAWAGWQRAWQALEAAEARVASLGGDEREVQARVEFLSWQRDEIARVDPRPGEDEALERERKKLASAERLRRGLTAAEDLIVAGDRAAGELVGRALQLVVEAERLDPSLGKVRGALVAAQAELEEAGRALSRARASLDADPGRLEVVDERLDAIKRLCRKHAATLEGVLARRAAIDAELDVLGRRTELRLEAVAERDRCLAAARAAAAGLSAERRAAAQRLEQAVRQGLARLAMGGARFEVSLTAAPLSAVGADQVEILFSANAGEPLRPLARVASGGEASRVMLAMKVALAESDTCGCSVFDEADAGIGGAVADVVGRLIKDISRHRQVLCITHLPQVAAHADEHLRIEKVEARGRVRSAVVALPPGEPRARELARMLSGVEITREALGAAEALLRSAVRHVKPKRPARPRDAERRSA